jgi:hypothetical protein
VEVATISFLDRTMTSQTTPAGVVRSTAEVEAIGANPAPVLRNLQITQAYHELSAFLLALTGPAANWCTFATWASKQAGQTIRQEDLARKIEDEFGRSEAFTVAVSRIREVLRAAGRPADDTRIAAAIREVCSPAQAIERSSDAVARGNRKVFEEIGREFARFIAMLQGGSPHDAEVIEGFGRALRPGGPPDGQDLLRAAFRDYHRALSAADAKAKAELMLLANLRIGLHEQTRLQPEIVEALNAPIADPGELRERLLRRLCPEAGWLLTLRLGMARRLGRTSPLDEACRRLADRLRQRVRAVVTEELMTLALPAGKLRLGGDVAGSYPEHLRSLANAELLDLVRAIDPTPDTTRESGAEDWADLAERMHFVADFFRTRQEDRSLFGPPFTPEQTQAIKECRMPAGRL